MATSIERISLNNSDIKLSINVWRGEPRVDIRHFENGYATKKGVSLNLQRWYHLMNAKNEIDEAKNKGFREHIGGNVFVEHKMGSWRGKPDSLQSPKTKTDASR